MKILWQNISTREIPGVPEAGRMWDALEAHIRSLTWPGTAVDFAYLPRASYFVASKYMELLNNVYILDELIRRESQGYDAAVIGCFNDPGLWEAREALTIPVIGVGEAAMMLAGMLGRNLGVVTVRKKLIPIIEENVRRYGFETRLIRRDPIRSCELDEKYYPGMFAAPQQAAIPAFESQAKAMSAEGAEVVIAGCASLGPALYMGGYTMVRGTRVPVISGPTVAIKMAESLAWLRRAHGLTTSKALKYQSLPKELMDGVRQSLGFNIGG